MLLLKPKPPEKLVFTTSTPRSSNIDQRVLAITKVIEHCNVPYSQIDSVKDLVLKNIDKVVALKPVVSENSIDKILEIIRYMSEGSGNFNSKSTADCESTLNMFRQKLDTKDFDTITSIVEARVAHFKNCNVTHPSIAAFNCLFATGFFKENVQYTRQSVHPYVLPVIRTALWLVSRYPELPFVEICALAKLTAPLLSQMDSYVEGAENTEHQHYYDYLIPVCAFYSQFANTYNMFYTRYMTTLASNSIIGSVLAPKQQCLCKELELESCLALRSFIEKRNQYLEETLKEEACITPFKPICLNSHELAIYNGKCKFDSRGIDHLQSTVDPKYKAVLPETISFIAVTDGISGDYAIPYFACVDEMLDIKVLFPFTPSTLNKLKTIYDLPSRNPLAPYNKDSDVLTNPLSTDFEQTVLRLFSTDYKIQISIGDSYRILPAGVPMYLGLEDITKYLTGTPPDPTAEPKDDNLFHAFILLVPQTTLNLNWLRKLQPTEDIHGQQS